MKKNIKRLFILCTLFLGVLTSCGVSNKNDDTTKVKQEEAKEQVQHLNVTQAELISKITDNEKYLNPNLLYDVERLEDDDQIGIIVTLDNAGLADTYFNKTGVYESIGAYAASSTGKALSSEMIKNQETLAKHLLDSGYIESVNHNYTTLLNGFSATTTYGSYKKLVKLDIVKKITISEAYSMPKVTTGGHNAVENVVDVYETGIFNSSTVEYTGENTAVAVLDSGFDVHHSVFGSMPNHPMITKDDVNTVLATTKASGFSAGLKAEDVYVNQKIPFAYDYADKDPDVTPFDSEHGTHVAGIIGGSDSTITGVAVNTQLVLLKVFGDLTTGAKTEDILAALEDAVLLDVDAINMSLGTSCGFSRLEDEDYLNSVYDKIEEAGISLIIAASNDYSSAYGGEDSNTNKVTNPDSATVGAPSTYTAALSVASISGTKSKYISTEDGYVFFFDEANSASAKPYDFYEMLNIPDGKDVVYEYVTVPGNGLRVNYSTIEVKGKVALVKRGDNSFEEKAQIAYENGAIACIIYNNISGDIIMSAGNDLKIPLCSISKDDGVYLASKKSGELVFNNSNAAGPFMSDFSSWGPNPDLKLKPEITAHGGNIKSAVPGGDYDQLSGTSMASPNMCGIVVLIRQYLKERFPSYDSKTISKMANDLLMSSATIALNEEGNVYSPRKQGAGLASLYNAVNTKAYLTVNGVDKAKLELGDDPKETGVYTLKFNLNNLSNEKLSYSLSNVTLSESVSTSDSDYVSEKSYLLNPTSAVKVSGDGSVSNNVITVNANGVACIEYTITLSEADKKYIRNNFKNGMYVEGFAMLDSKNEDQIDLSIPFLAFFGDWTKAPMFDKTYYEVESTAHDKSLDEEDKIKADYYATTPLGTYYYNYIIPLGSYVYTMDETMYNAIPATEEHAALSYDYNTINGITCIYAGLLRNAKKMTTTITNTLTGEVVYEHINYNQLKAHYNGAQIPSYDLLNLSIEELGLSNNTNYTFTMVGELDYGDGGAENNLNNSFSFSFYVDYETPIITDAQFRANYDKTQKKNRYYVDVFVYDNHYTQSVRPFTLLEGGLVSLCEYPTPVYGEKGTVSKVTLEITDYIDLLQYGSDGLVNGLGIMVDDYAMNSGYYYITFPGTNANDLYFTDAEGEKITSYQTVVGQEVNLAQMLVSDDPEFNKDYEFQTDFMERMEWTSSDNTIVRIHNGKIEGIAPGVATVTVRTVTSEGRYTTASISIMVEQQSQAVSYALNDSVILKDLKFSYYDTIKAFIDGPERSEIGDTGDRTFFSETPTISFWPSEQVQIGYDIDPWNLDPSRYTLTWSSTNPAVASVDQTGLVTALKKGSARIMLRITVDGRLSNILASVPVTVKDEFIIEGRILTGYKGFGGDVVIPDDKGIMYIGSYAFALYTTDMSIKVDEDDWDRNKTPGVNDTVTSVTIPYDVTEIQKYAFYNCTGLSKVEFAFGPKDESCKTIREHAFEGCSSLTDINSSHVQVIGDSAFKNCTSLTEFDFSKIYALGNAAFKGCTSLETVNLTTLRNAWPETFADCTNLKNFISGVNTKLSESMFENTGLVDITIYSDRIPARTFANCKDLKSVDINKDVIYVGDYAFTGCSSLNSVKFSGSCDFIYNNAFSNLPITSFKFPNSKVELEEYIFLGCSKLATIEIAANTEIADNLGSIFQGCSALKNIKVDSANQLYSSNGNLLMNKAGDEIILAVSGATYGAYKIPDGVKKIAAGAFSGIQALTTLDLNQVEEVGKYAFAECGSLTTITFPQNGIKLGRSAFEACSKLRTLANLNKLTDIADYAFSSIAVSSVELGDDVIVGEGSFGNNSNLKVVNLGANAKLGFGAFAACGGLTMVNVKGDGLEVGPYAFASCVKLATIDLSKAVGTIGVSAFENCQVLTKADLQNITRVEDFAFADCYKLVTVNVPVIEYIGDAAFGAGSENSTSGASFTAIELPASLKHIGEAAFYGCINLKTITIPANCEVLGHAFAYCVSLQSAVIEEGMKELPAYLFGADSALLSVDMKDIEVINEGAFYHCTRLKTIDLSTVKVFGESAFDNCSALTSLDLPEATFLGDGAFFACQNVEGISIPKVEYIGEQALSSIKVGSIALPTSLSFVAPTAFYNNEKQTAFVAVVDDNTVDTAVLNDYAQIINGALYTTSPNKKLVLSAYPTGKINDEFVVAEGTVYIELFAAAQNLYLKKIVFPETLKSIANMCFYGCKNLESVEFRSTTAPVLEGLPLGSQSDYSYTEGMPVYDLLMKYLNFNGSYPYYYGQFNVMAGTADLLKIILPANDNVSGYSDNIIYKLYFDLENAVISDHISKDSNTINYLEKIAKVPLNNITLKDESVILEARAAASALKQDLTLFGYTKEEVLEMSDRLANALSKLDELRANDISKKYQELISGIAGLGAFKVSKMDTYNDLVKAYDSVPAADKAYIDRTNLDLFKEGYDATIKSLQEDIEQLDKISEFPSVEAANRLVYGVILTQSLFTCMSLLAFFKKWF